MLLTRYRPGRSSSLMNSTVVMSPKDAIDVMMVILLHLTEASLLFLPSVQSFLAVGKIPAVE